MSSMRPISNVVSSDSAASAWPAAAVARAVSAGFALAPAGTVAAWFCWWAIIAYFERRARNAGPVTLGTHLTG